MCRSGSSPRLFIFRRARTSTHGCPERVNGWARFGSRLRGRKRARRASRSSRAGGLGTLLAVVGSTLVLTVPMDCLPPSNTNATSPKRPFSTRSFANNSSPSWLGLEGRVRPSPGSSSERSAPISSAGSSLMDSCVFIAMRADTIGSSRFPARVEASARPVAAGEWRRQRLGSSIACCLMCPSVSGYSHFLIPFDTAVPGMQVS